MVNQETLQDSSCRAKKRTFFNTSSEYMGIILLPCMAYTKDPQFIYITYVTCAEIFQEVYYICRSHSELMSHKQVSQKYVTYSVTNSKKDLLFPWVQRLSRISLSPWFRALSFTKTKIAGHGYPSKHISKLNNIVTACITNRETDSSSS